MQAVAGFLVRHDLVMGGLSEADPEGSQLMIDALEFGLRLAVICHHGGGGRAFVAFGLTGRLCRLGHVGEMLDNVSGKRGEMHGRQAHCSAGEKIWMRRRDSLLASTVALGGRLRASSDIDDSSPSYPVQDLSERQSMYRYHGIYNKHKTGESNFQLVLWIRKQLKRRSPWCANASANAAL